MRLISNRPIIKLINVFSIVKNVPECKDLIRKEDVLKLCKSTDSDIKRYVTELCHMCLNGALEIICFSSALCHKVMIKTLTKRRIL